MHSFNELSAIFEEKFSKRHFPEHTPSLYDPAQYILGLKGKRVRHVCVLMVNELFADIVPDAYHIANAIELFHNFSLIHDDIMDKAPLRRGMENVHTKYGESTALLAGDAMLIQAYEYVVKIKPDHLQKILQLFNKTAKEVCEGQQLDMDFEKRGTVSFEEYLNMITLKTSVLLAASLQLGAIIGGARESNQSQLYEFGKNLGIAFQIQDDYLDAFGDASLVGKQIGGDITANNNTFLMIRAIETASASQQKELKRLMTENPVDKVDKVLQIFKDSKADSWTKELKDQYLETSLKQLDDIAVLSSRKQPLAELAEYLIQRNK